MPLNSQAKICFNPESSLLPPPPSPTQLNYTIPPSIRALLSMKGHSSNTAQPHPPLRKRSSIGSSVNRHRRPSGVQYLSPSKSSSTDVAREPPGDGQPEGCASHEPAEMVTDSAAINCIPSAGLDSTSREHRHTAEETEEGEMSEEVPRVSTEDKAVQSCRRCNDLSTATEPHSSLYPLREQNRVRSLVSQLRICNPASCVTTADRTATLESPVGMEDDSMEVQGHASGPCHISDDLNCQTSIPVLVSAPPPSVYQRPPSLSDYSKLFGDGNGSMSSVTRNSIRKLPSTVLPLAKHTEAAAGGGAQPGIEDFFVPEERSCQTRGSGVSHFSMLAAHDHNGRELIMELQRHDLTSPVVQRILKAALELGTGPAGSMVHSKEGVAASDGGVAPTTIHNAVEPPDIGNCGITFSTGKGKEKVGTKRARKVCESKGELPIPKKPRKELPVNSNLQAADASLGCPQECKLFHCSCYCTCVIATMNVVTVFTTVHIPLHKISVD